MKTTRNGKAVTLGWGHLAYLILAVVCLFLGDKWAATTLVALAAYDRASKLCDIFDGTAVTWEEVITSDET